MRAWLVAAVFLAGCSAQAAPPDAPELEGSFTAVAFRVEPTTTDLDHDGTLAWGGCSVVLNALCTTAPDQFGELEWLTRVDDTAAVFWRVNATLEWAEDSPRHLVLELRAVNTRGCPEPADSCGSSRILDGAAGPSPVHLAAEYFLAADETAIEVVVRPKPFDPYETTPAGQAASLSGRLASYHPVSGPIAVNVTAA